MGFLTLLYIKISLYVIARRRQYQVLYGPGENSQIAGAIASHSNFVAYVPMLILLMYFVEVVGKAPWWLVIPFGLAIFIGRCLHFQGLKENDEQLSQQRELVLKKRIMGMKLTIFSMIGLSILAIVLPIKELFF